MNLYEKIAQARIAFAEMQVKKMGKNTFAGYTYFTLDEILPATNAIGRDLKFVTKFDTDAKTASLTIIDCEKPDDRLTFSVAYIRTVTETTKTMKDGTVVKSVDSQAAALKGCHQAQNEGAAITYLKRYLYLNAFEISEGDVLDATMDPAADKVKMPPKKKTFCDVMGEFPKENVQKVLGSLGYESLDDVPKEKQGEVYHSVKDMC